MENAFLEAPKKGGLDMSFRYFAWWQKQLNTKNMYSLGFSYGTGLDRNNGQEVKNKVCREKSLKKTLIFRVVSAGQCMLEKPFFVD